MVLKQKAKEKIILKLEYIPEDEIPFFFAAADALILPYRKHYMGAAGPLKTALGFGLPVIATKVRELDEFLRMDRIGIAMEPESMESKSF